MNAVAEGPSYVFFRVLIGECFALNFIERLSLDLGCNKDLLPSYPSVRSAQRSVRRCVVPSRGRNSNSLLTVTGMVRNSCRLDSWEAGFDIVKVSLALLERIEKRSADDIVVGVAIIFVGLTVDISNRRRQRRAEMAEQRLRVLKATMITVQDIVKNFLNNIQLLRIEAEGAFARRNAGTIGRGG
jgi:hypothetical protein